jgi:excinuclease UvrABC nuclease subunit
VIRLKCFFEGFFQISPARKLLQYVRDEAHRFAQHYHHILRSKKVIG